MLDKIVSTIKQWYLDIKGDVESLTKEKDLLLSEAEIAIKNLESKLVAKKEALANTVATLEKEIADKKTVLQNDLKAATDKVDAKIAEAKASLAKVEEHLKTHNITPAAVVKEVENVVDSIEKKV
jgi:hypothetical protein